MKPVNKSAIWKPIKNCRVRDYKQVDLWLVIPPSPRSMGMGDSFRVVDAERRDGKWVHMYKGEMAEIFSDYITHWMPIPKPPNPNNGK